MGFIADLFNSGKGAGFQATGAPTLGTTNGGELTDAYTNSQDALSQQKNFLAALQSQNGVQNQNDVLNALKGVASGTGPNPAQAMLNSATGANVAQTAALAAGQRGASANPALIARQAAIAGAGAQQNAAGQAANLQANQSLNAINQEGGVAGQQVSNLAGATGALNQATQSEQQNLLNAAAQKNNTDVAMQSNINNVNGGIAQGNQKAQQGLAGGILGGVGSLLGLGLAKGGMVPTRKIMMAAGGVAPSAAHGFLFGSAPSANADTPAPAPAPAPAQNLMASADPIMQGSEAFAKGLGQRIGSLIKPAGGVAPITAPAVGGQFAGTAPSLGVSMDVGAPMGNPFEMKAKGGNVGGKLKSGGKVPGKSAVKGDSLKNDIVDAKLSPGEIVIPRSIATHADAPAKAAAFVAAVLKKQGLRR